jgi:nicotinamide-nucleotide amidase
MFDTLLLDKARQLLDQCRSADLKLATAESCTGGLLAGLLTDIPGSSDVVERGYVTYSNASKSEAIGVSADLIATYGAVSADVAKAMAQGALKVSRADIAIAITGVAGPGGGSDEKPVGLVHLALARRGVSVRHRECRFGDIGRSEVRRATLLVALEMVSAAAEPTAP